MRKFRFIFIISVLILSLALPCFATVTESSGDGFAVYNGVKLLDVSSVWEESSSFPFAFLFYNNENLPVLYVFESRPWISTTTERVITNNGYSAYMVSNGSWSLVANYGSAGERTLIPPSWVFWSSFDLGYSSNPSSSDTPYLAASTPISLDDMKVIEWDGIADGLPTYSTAFLGDTLSFTLVSDIIPQFSSDQVLSFFNSLDGLQSGYLPADVILSGDGLSAVGSQLVSVSSEGSNFESLYPSLFPSLVFPDTGLYFGSSPTNSAYTQLFAYRESETEGPTGAVTGLSIITPPLGASDYIVYAGTELQCAAQVIGTGDYNPAVTWSLSHSSSSSEYYPTISESGLLSVLPGVPEQRIFITATSVADPTIYATVPVYIMPLAVSSVTITPSSATAAPGQNIQFSATVSGSNVVDSAVTWAVGGASSASTRITVDGLLLIGSDEVSPVIAVRATSNQVSSVYATALVNINVPAVVTGVSITPDDVVLNRGDMQQFTATVSGTGSFDSSVTWQITSVYSAGTSITNNGLLTVSNEQKYDYIIIKATSTADPTKSAVAYVFVEDAVSDPMNIDLSVLERLLSQIEQYTKSIQYMLSYQNWFREFDFTTGQLSTQEDYIVGFVPNFYRFMQNMEQYVGQLAYRTASGSELNSRNEFTSLWDALFNFQSFQTSAGSSLGAGVFFKDTGKIFTIFTNFNGYFDTGYGIDDLWDYFNTDHISSFLSYETAYDLNPLAVAAPSDDSDPFNMFYYWEHQNEAQAWRDKYK